MEGPGTVHMTGSCYGEPTREEGLNGGSDWRKNKSKEVLSSRALGEKIHKLSEKEGKKILKRKIFVSKDPIKLKKIKVEGSDETADTSLRDLVRFSACNDDDIDDSTDRDEGRVKSAKIQIITPQSDDSSEDDVGEDRHGKCFNPSADTF